MDKEDKTAAFGQRFFFVCGLVSLVRRFFVSKRTKIYADVGSAKETDAKRNTGVDFGIQHNF